MIILDTNVISEEMRPTPDAGVHRWLQRHDPLDLYTTSICEAEIRYGIAIRPDGRRKRDLQSAANNILALFEGRILPFDSNAALVFAEISARRRSMGRPVKDFDAQIAAIARSRGMAVATRDISDFQEIGLSLIDPWSP